MSDKTAIEWTDATWNPVTGCSKVSRGCKHCYAETVAGRFWGERKFTDVLCHPERLDQPLRWKRPRRIFVNSMSDLFHEDVPDEFIDQVFAIMALARQHTFQVLTKRTERMLLYLSNRKITERLGESIVNGAIDFPIQGGVADAELDWPDPTERARLKIWPLPNVWLGVSVEDQEAADARIPLLLQTPAAVRFLSCEPLLGSITFEGMFANQKDYRDGTNALEEIDWVIAGGESGPRARPMHPAWLRDLRDQCVEVGVPFFFKQHGEWLATEFCTDEQADLPHSDLAYVEMDGDFHHGPGVDFFGNDEQTARVGKRAAGRMLDGRTWDQMPRGAT